MFADFFENDECNDNFMPPPCLTENVELCVNVGSMTLTLEQILEGFSNLHRNKSIGPDFVPPIVLKNFTQQNTP